MTEISEEQLAPITDADLALWENFCKRKDGHCVAANVTTMRRFCQTVRRLQKENEDQAEKLHYIRLLLEAGEVACAGCHHIIDGLHWLSESEVQ